MKSFHLKISNRFEVLEDFILETETTDLLTAGKVSYDKCLKVSEFLLSFFQFLIANFVLRVSCQSGNQFKVKKNHA